MTEAGPAKKHVFCSGMDAGMGCKTLACALAVRILWPQALQLTAVCLITFSFNKNWAFFKQEYARPGFYFPIPVP
jgi:hypothetical protein